MFHLTLKIIHIYTIIQILFTDDLKIVLTINLKIFSHQQLNILKPSTKGLYLFYTLHNINYSRNADGLRNRSLKYSTLQRTLDLNI